MPNLSSLVQDTLERTGKAKQTGHWYYLYLSPRLVSHGAGFSVSVFSLPAIKLQSTHLRPGVTEPAFESCR